MKIDDIEIYQKFANKWIASDSETKELLAVGDSIIEVEKKLSKNIKNVQISFVNSPDHYLSP